MNPLEACHLCPRACGVNRLAGETGFCGAGKAVKIGRAALHQWEEPCISGTKGSGTVFFSYCTLRCVFCQNASISAGGSGKEVSVHTLSQIFMKLQEQGAHNINLVTPSHYTPQIVEALMLAKSHGLSIPVVFNCGGYESIGTLKRLDGYVDIYLPDFKYYSVYYAQKYSHAEDYFDVTLEAVTEMLRQVGKPVFDENGILQKGVIIRHLMLPGLLSDTKQVLRTIAKNFGDYVLVSLMQQYTPLPHVSKFPELNKAIDPNDYGNALDFMAELGLTNGYIQERDAIAESFIPSFNGEGVP